MRPAVAYIIEGTITALVLFWVITNPQGVTDIAVASGKGLVGSARALWGGGVNPMH